MIEKNVEHGRHVHGAKWAAVDDGNFVNPEVARPLVDADHWDGGAKCRKR